MRWGLNDLAQGGILAVVPRVWVWFRFRVWFRVRNRVRVWVRVRVRVWVRVWMILHREGSLRSYLGLG